jgi:hypothetical protein
VLRFADLKKQRSRLANWSAGGRSMSHVRPAAPAAPKSVR